MGDVQQAGEVSPTDPALDVLSDVNETTSAAAHVDPLTESSVCL